MSSSVDTGVALIAAEDEKIRWALKDASIPALMASMMHLTGNTDIQRGDHRPMVVPLAEEEDGLSEDQREVVREQAFQIIKVFKAGDAKVRTPSEEMIVETMNFITGVPIPDDYFPLLREELVLFDEDPRNIELGDEISDETRQDFKVVIIGAGMSGILAAIRMKQAGLPYIVLDKNETLGGTWWENTYPGCRVDSANHLYSYLFEPKNDWPGYYSDRETLFGYFDDVVNKYEIRNSIQLGTTVESATFDESTNMWTVACTKADGSTETLEANAVITAMGQLNMPKPPDLPGVGSFEGINFHSARWEHEHDLSGKRVAVIGTGCSATQFVPEIAKDVGELFVFQRTPPWLMPTPEYHEAVSDEKHWLVENLPFYAKWFRFYIFRSAGADGLLAFLYGEDGWNKREDSVSSLNDQFREALTEHILEQTSDDPHLAANSVPKYPPGGKRPVVDNGVWFQALKQDNVELIVDPIAEITPKGLKLESGREVEVDVLIYGTGFHADHFFWPIKFYGKDGVELSEKWDGDPRAFKGVSVPDFPNLFCLYGPNTNIVVGSSIIFFSECEMRYVMGCLKILLGEGHATMDCKQEAYEDYNKFIDEGNSKMAWGAPNVKSWYKNSKGRVTQNWPGTHNEFWQTTKAPNAADYDFK